MPVGIHESAPLSDGSGGVSHELESKFEVCSRLKSRCLAVVKLLLKPMYSARQLSKEQFKAVAHAATHALADAITNGALPLGALQTEDGPVRDVVTRELRVQGVHVHLC